MKLGAKVKTFSTIFEDNQGAVALANVPKLNPRTKHIAVKYHFFREHISKGSIAVAWIPSDKQKADILTKGLGTEKFVAIRKLLLGW